jgi:copper(I)-binding protein
MPGAAVPASGRIFQDIPMLLRKLYIAGAAALIACGPAAALAQQAGTLQIEHPWVRATAPSQTTGAGYLAIHNSGAAADTLLSVNSDVAGMAEVHKVSKADGMVKMGPVQGGLAIPGGKTVDLSPGGSYHIMFMHLKGPFKAGEKVAATLNFAHAGKVAVTFEVKPLTYQPASGQADGMSMDHMNMDHGDAGGHMNMKMMKMAPSGHGN